MKFYSPSVPQGLLKLLSCVLGLTFVCVTAANAAITIANEGTTNPTLLYEGKPMFKAGPLPEVAVFAVKWGSREFQHRTWLDWMAASGLGYGRVYPESGYPWLPYHADGRVFPFEVARWKDGKPIVDLTRFNPEYWSNVARVIEECGRRGIVLQMQLYQRVFFEDQEEPNEGWVTNYFHPANNVNEFSVPQQRKGDGVWSAVTGFLDGLIGAEMPRDGYGLFQATTQETVWRDLHRQWVEHILEAIGSHGNVIIDLMNEAAFNKGMTKDWIEFTLDIIERWEKETGNDLRVGMDFDHIYKAFLKTGDAGELEYILSHPRLDVIIAEGSESHVVPDLVAGDDRQPLHKDLAVEFRRRYHKPVISTNSPAYGAEDDLEALHLYQWYSLMTKVQGAGVYAKDYTIDFASPPYREYAQRSRNLIRFFKRLESYTELQPVPDAAVTAPGQYKLALSSSEEIVVYVHTGRSAEAVGAGARLALKAPAMPEGAVAIKAIDPHTGRSRQWQGRAQDGALATELPGFEKDLAIHIVPAGQAGSADK